MNLDNLKIFPNQTAEHRLNECVDETIALIVGNIFKIPMNPGFNYGAYFHLLGITPNTGGTEPYINLQAQLVYGSLSSSVNNEDWGDQLEDNFTNYSLSDKLEASKYRLEGILTLNSYQAIKDYLDSQQRGVALIVDWYESFNTPNADGTLPAPVGNHSEHCVAIWEDTVFGLRLTPHLGPDYGVGGYGFMSKTTFNLVFKQALAFDKNAWRWLSLLKVLTQHWNAFQDIYPLLSASSV